MRIVSLVPSITELLSDLQLEKEVVGITKFCVHPNIWYRNKKRIGGTKTLHLEVIEYLEPDLIIANKEENTKEQIEVLAKNYNVLVTEIRSLADNVNLIKLLGEKTKREHEALSLIKQFEAAFGQTQKKRNKSAAYLIWQDPIMTIGGDTYIHNVMEHIGLYNIFGERFRYPDTTIKELRQLSPQMILLSSEPYPFKQKHVEHFKNELPDTDVRLVDGEAFSWYGTRFIRKAEYLSAF